MADGKIVFRTAIDNSGIQKDLDDAKKKIDAANKDIEKTEAAKLPLVDESEKLVTVLDEAKRKLHELQEEKEKVDAALNSEDVATYLDAYDKKDAAAEAVKQQEKVVVNLQKRWDAVEDKIDKYNKKINQSKRIIEEQTVRAGELSAQLAEGGESMVVATTKASKKTSELGKRLVSLARSALMFSVITAGLTAMRNYMGKALKTNDQFTAQLAKLKAAMLTAFQPIYEVVVPALITLMKILTVVFQWIARLLSLLGGKTAKQSADAAEAIYKEAKAIDAVGSAAKKAQKSLAGFDEITTIGGNTDGAGSNSSVVSPDFSDFSIDDSISDDLNNILGLVASIGAALLTWNIAKNFVPDLKTAVGAALSVGGALLYAFNWGDAFVNGVDWTNLQGMMLGITAAGIGLFIVFGSVGAAIAALIGGVGLIVLGLKEFIETGEVTDETLVALEAGILLVGIAISALTGGWIPALIAAVAGLVLFIATRGDEIKSVLNGIDEWLQGVFAKDWTEVFGPVLGGALNFFFEVVEEVWGGIKKILEGIIDFVTGVFTGDWKKAWDAIGQILVGVFDIFGIDIVGFVNGIIDTVNGLISAITSGLNFVIRAINKISVTVPDWDLFGDMAGTKFGFNLRPIDPFQIPPLAKGAVLPANKPFLAMVGDQKHGTNIEAPLETIQEAVAMVMDQYAASNLAGQEAIIGVLREILEAILGIEIGDDVIGQAVARYNRKMAVVRGGT